MVGRRKRVEEYLGVFRHGYIVPTTVASDAVWCGTGIFERYAVEVPLEGGLCGGHEVEETVALIDTANCASSAVAYDFPLAAGQRPDQLAARVVEIQVFETRAAGGPDELFGFLQESQLIVEIDPGIAVLAEQLGRGSGGRIRLQEREGFLVAALALYGEAGAVGKPVHSRQVNIRVRA